MSVGHANDEIGLATLHALHSNDDTRSNAAWCRIVRRPMLRVRVLRDIPGKFGWRAGQDFWVWADRLTSSGDIDSHVWGFFPAGSFEIVNRIDESGAVS